jgi:signal transduction histidine kinase
MKQETQVNILIVDDDESNLLALEAVLQGLNQNLVRATSGEEALRRILEMDFAVILLDVQMHGMNGIETAATIRERERSRHIPIIFLTGVLKTDEMMFQGYSAGAVDYLMKPIVPDVLRAKIDVFVELALIRVKLQREIEERKKNAAEILKLNTELQDKNRELEERSVLLQETISELESYSYSISHDMRAPLRAMKGFAEVLLEEALPNLSPEHQRYLRKIEAGAGRMDQLIRDVLSYSQVSRSKLELKEIDLDGLVHQIIEHYPETQETGSRIEIEGRLPKVLGNEAMLTQCISNLLGNAIKFVPAETKPQIRIRSEKNGQRERIWFEDNGIGIAPGDIERIFGIFVKVHPANVYQGTGIGLSIVQKSVEKMKGKVGVESELGKGSRVWIELQTGQTL